MRHLSLLAWVLSAPLAAATFTVTNTSDSGAGSLRQAILDANATPGLDTIAFGIPGSGVQTIAIGSNLEVTDPVLIDGYSQPGSSPNTLAVGDDAAILIVIDGGTTGPVLALEVGSGGSTVRGLSIVQSLGGGSMLLVQSSNNTITGNFVGVAPDGVTLGGVNNGIGVFGGTTGNVIGGTPPSARNVVASSAGELITADGDAMVVQGNYLGLTAAGTAALGAGPRAINVELGTGTTIGGIAPGAGNVIGNYTIRAIQIGEAGFFTTAGVLIQNNLVGTDATGAVRVTSGGPDALSIGRVDDVAIRGNIVVNPAGTGIELVGPIGQITIQGNSIGTDATATVPLRTGLCGIHVGGGVGTPAATIGGRNSGEGNAIAFAGSHGIAMDNTVSGWTVVGNSIFGSALLGISLTGSCGNVIAIPTPNDPGDTDTGANGLQNFPIIQSVSHPDGGHTDVLGKLDSTPSTAYTLDFYADAACSNFPREFLQGRTYLGSAPVSTDASGHASFAIPLPVGTEEGARITATATDPLGNTSELAQRIVFSISPTSGPATGGTSVDVAGTDFVDPSTVTVGGVDAQATFMSDHHLQITTPALSPGTVNDVVATTPDGTSGTLVKGWVADFLDVPAGQQFYSFVTTLVSNAITVGVGGGLYGVNDDTLRQQMAVFLLKGKHGLCYTPPPCSGTFADVPCPSTFANWIEALAAEGITGGCGGGNYCPQNPVRRDQMAVFLLKAEHGSTYTPPDCAGVFADVPCPSTFANWIEQLAAEQITGGCGGGNYCPDNNNTRGQMAVFITKTFNLQ
jgi:hypothetical protein